MSDQPVQDQLIKLPPDEKDLSLCTAGAYLGRVKLCQASSDYVQSGEIPRGGHFVLETETGIHDLGTAFQFLPLGGREKAIDYSTPDVIVSYDASTPTFQKIAMNSRFGSQRMAGPEHLIYVPSVGEFAYMYCYNKTLKEVSAKIQASKGRPVELESYFYKGSKNSWHKCKLNVSPPFEIPSVEKIQRAIDAFRDEEKESTELAPEESGREV